MSNDRNSFSFTIFSHMWKIWKTLARFSEVRSLCEKIRNYWKVLNRSSFFNQIRTTQKKLPILTRIFGRTLSTFIRATRLNSARLILSTLDHSSFVVDWYFEHAVNCRDFIIINLWIKRAHTAREWTWTSGRPVEREFLCRWMNSEAEMEEKKA